MSNRTANPDPETINTMTYRLGQHGATITARFATFEESEAFAASCPKNMKVTASYVSKYDGDRGESYITPMCDVRIDLAPRKGNDINETGLKRAIKALAKFETLGFEVTLNTMHPTMSPAEFVQMAEELLAR